MEGFCNSSEALEVNVGQLRDRKFKRKDLCQKSKMLTEEGKRVLDEQNFRSRDFWEGYKLYCFAHYSHCQRSKVQFIKSKMGRVVSLIKKQVTAHWGSVYDEKVREVWAMMEEYGYIWHGQDWKNLRALMEEFDDVKELCASENGCLLLQVVEDDEDGTKSRHRHSYALQLHGTNIFDEINVRLKRVRSNLNTLLTSSKAASESRRKKRSKLLATELPSAGM